MAQRSYYTAAGLTLVIALTLLNSPPAVTQRLRFVIGSLYLPLFGMAGSGQTLWSQARGALVPRRQLEAQVRSLRLENQQLRLHLSQLEEAWRENTRFREALGWKQRSPWQLKAARVVGHDPANWWQSVHIDLGRRHGMRPNLPVVTQDGVVGRVAEVGISQSRVVLVGDPACRVAAQIRETREKGVIEPGPVTLDRRWVELTYLPAGAEAQPGHTVMTSGDGGVFPKGLVIGQITAVEDRSYGLYLDAQVRLAANYNRLEEVWVLIP